MLIRNGGERLRDECNSNGTREKGTYASEQGQIMMEHFSLIKIIPRYI